MSIVSFVFLGYCLITAILYFAVPKRFQKYILLLSSIVFYALYSYKALYYVVFTSLSIYFGARGMEKLRDRANAADTPEERATKYRKQAKAIFLAALISNLFILFFLKFFNFSAQNINTLTQLLGGSFRMRTLDILMPLGISFYTFSAISYLIDVKREKYRAQQRYDYLLLFMIYFPQLIQGPINKYDEMAPQLLAGHTVDYNRVIKGLQRIAWGFFKKLLIADRIAVFVANVFDIEQNHVGITVFLGALAYSIQIYGDFSGGIDIVMGFSEILGINMMENFKRPFFAETLTDFWQRWHISLGTWMREYIFYPIAFSPKLNKIGKKLRKAGHKKAAKVIPPSLASVIVFFCVGIWHGASWRYIVYGLYNGFIISGGILIQDKLDYITHKIFKADTKVFSWRLFRILRTLLITTFGRYLSRADRLRDTWILWKRTFKQWNPWVLFDGSLYKLGLDRKEFNVIFFALLVLFVVSLYQERSGGSMRDWLNRQNLYFRVAVQVAFILVIAVYGYYGPQFEAANFIYAGF